MPPKESSGEMASASASRKDGDARSEEKLRCFHQRVLLLYHAVQCQHQAGYCPVTPHCALMKRLWEHIGHCKNKSCSVQHCLSSRFVLSHFKQCKDPRCARCGPVRQMILRKSKQRVQMNPVDPPIGMIATVPVAVVVVMAPVAVHAVPAPRATQQPNPRGEDHGSRQSPAASRHLVDKPSNRHDV